LAPRIGIAVRMRNSDHSCNGWLKLFDRKRMDSFRLNNNGSGMSFR
jgi:hypothetical protein